MIPPAGLFLMSAVHTCRETSYSFFSSSIANLTSEVSIAKKDKLSITEKKEMKTNFG